MRLRQNVRRVRRLERSARGTGDGNESAGLNRAAATERATERAGARQGRALMLEGPGVGVCGPGKCPLVKLDSVAENALGVLQLPF